MIALVGSQALLRHCIDLGRLPKDWDFIGHPQDVYTYIKESKVDFVYPKNGAKKLIAGKNGMMWEFELAWSGSTGAEFLELASKPGTYLQMFGEPKIVPSLDLLYTLKLSHRFLKNSPHFLKTMRHLQILEAEGAKVRPEYQEWLKRREKETYNYGHPKLNVSKKEFFNSDSGIEYKYDHDSIHRAMAHFDMPAYEYFKDDKAEVKCSKEKFFTSGQSTRLYSVLEEVQVLALERSQIPFPNTNPRWSFNKAHEKVCTSISSGWWREFAYYNYDNVQDMYEPDYVDKFYNGVATGVVKKL